MNIIIQFTPVVMVFIMFGIGMNVNKKNFFEVFKDLKSLSTGLLLQIIILPTIGLTFAFFGPDNLVLKLGIILITCVPSAVSSNYITKLAGGNVALSVSLTAITACLSFITIPFILTIVAPIVLDEESTFQKLNLIKMSLSLLCIATIPIILGIYINTKFPIFLKKINKFYSIFSLFLFSIIIFTAWFSEWSTIIFLYKTVGLLALSLAIVILIISYTLVNLLNLNEVNKKTIIIESFIQNAAMAIIVGGLTFGANSGYLAIAALYALLQYKILLFLWTVNKFLKT
jgi:BASS family bile acid:Na+ symporter|tara:strand:- start:773 stop:1630 length:858 start_codon:yes stop_codon:yes gene_type:complete